MQQDAEYAEYFLKRINSLQLVQADGSLRVSFQIETKIGALDEKFVLLPKPTTPEILVSMVSEVVSN